MSIGINTYQTTRQLNRFQGDLSSAAERLTSGKRLNSASDDSAGSAIAQQLEAARREFDASRRNASDGISVLQAADAGVESVETRLQRLRELAVQSSNGILSDDDRAALDTEAQQLTDEISKVIDTTDFNGRKLLSDPQSVNIQLGSSDTDTVNISTHALDDELATAGVSNISLSSQSGATDAIARIDATLEKTSQQRSDYGAAQNRLSASIENISARQQSVSASQSRLEDTDMATEAANFSRSKLQENATLSLQAQANASARSVLALLS